MALETIQQILAPNNAPYINGVAARLKFSAAVLKNLYQGLVEKDGKGVDDNWVSASDAEQNAQIIVHRVRPVEINPREMGANKNGASYSQNQHYIQTESVAIEILTVIDDPILIPRARQDRIAVDLLAEQTEIFSNRLATIINGATTASKILATYLAKSNGQDVNEVVISSTDVANKLVLDKFIEGNSLLDEGDIAHGIDIFPLKTRIAIFRVSYRATLKAGGVLVLGKGDEVYRILAGSGLNNQGEARTEEDGFIGTIDGVEVRLLSNESLGHAARFLGFEKNEFKKGSVFAGYISSSYANARGVSTSKQTQVVNEVNGQGVRLLPYVALGAVSWYPLGNVFFTSAAWNPFGDLKTLFSSVASQITFKLKGYGSRLVPVIPTVTITAGTGFSVGEIRADDDWGVVNHCLAAAYYVGTSAATTVSEFLAGHAAASDTGTIDVDGDTVSETALTTGKYLNILAISDDGTCKVYSKVA